MPPLSATLGGIIGQFKRLGMQLKEIIGTDCYIDCESVEEVSKMVIAIEVLGVMPCKIQQKYGIGIDDDTITIDTRNEYATVTYLCCERDVTHYPASLFLNETT